MSVWKLHSHLCDPIELQLTIWFELAASTISMYQLGLCKVYRGLSWQFKDTFLKQIPKCLLSPLSMERVLAPLLFAALLFAARVNNSSADNPFP